MMKGLNPMKQTKKTKNHRSQSKPRVHATPHSHQSTVEEKKETKHSYATLLKKKLPQYVLSEYAIPFTRLLEAKLVDLKSRI